MRDTILLLFTVLLFFQACSKSDNKVDIPTCDDCEFTCIGEDNGLEIWTNDCRDNWTCEFEVLTNSRIATDETFGIGDGDNTVFRMVASTQGDLAIADDEFTSILVFELDSGQESFSLEGDALLDMNVQHLLSCFCPNVAFRPAASGCLQGERQDDGSWFVQSNLTFNDLNFDTPFELAVDAQFVE